MRIFGMALNGDLVGASEEYERARALFGDDEGNVNWFTTLGRLGTSRMRTRDEIPMKGQSGL
jgi:hypothetical protein